MQVAMRHAIVNNDMDRSALVTTYGLLPQPLSFPDVSQMLIYSATNSSPYSDAEVDLGKE
jgi:hypothetical protein